MTKSFSVLSVLMLMSVSLQAQFVLVSENRSVSAGGSAAAKDQKTAFGLTNRSNNASPVFSGTVSSNAAAYSVGTGPYGQDVSAYACSRAYQQSSISAAGISVSYDLQAQTWSDLPTWGGACSATAESLFEITFNVSSPTAFNVLCSGLFFSHDYPELNFTCTLGSQESGTVFALSRNDASAGAAFVVNLMPGQDYTLNFAGSAASAIPDPLGEMGVVHAEFSLTEVSSVPEPASTTLVLLGAGAWFLRRQAKWGDVRA